MISQRSTSLAPRSSLVAAFAALALLCGAGCKGPEPKPAPAEGPKPAAGSGSAAKEETVRPAVETVKPAIDIATPPADAVKLPSGMIYKKLATAEGPSPTRNDTVVIHFSGWKQATGETFNTTRTRGTPMPLDLSGPGASGYADVLTQVHKGEKVMMWMPAEVVGKTTQGKAEALAFEVELIDIQPAPVVPADVAAPPPGARTTKGGLRYVVVTPGTGTEKVRFFDTASFRYTIWDATGKMLSSTEKRSRPVSSALYRQPQPLEDIMTTMVPGQRTRFWVDSAKVGQVGLEPTKGLLCYELTVLEVTKGAAAPPPTPADVKAPPPGTKKTAAGVFYRVLKTGKSTDQPKPTDTVRVHYTGWTTDGRMFDSSVVSGQPASFPLTGVIKGWTDGIPQMKVGETARFWIPKELAYEGKPGNPQGMLVFDVELIEILPAAAPNPHGDPHGAMGGAMGGSMGGHGADDGHGH